MPIDFSRLPEREHFSINEISQRWQCSTALIWDYMNREILRPMVLSSTIVEDEATLMFIAPFAGHYENKILISVLCRPDRNLENLPTEWTYLPLPKFLYLSPDVFNPRRFDIGEIYQLPVNRFLDFSGACWHLCIRWDEIETCPAPASIEYGFEDIYPASLIASPLLISREERDRFESEHGLVYLPEEDRPEAANQNSLWPWGQYETELLRQISNAAKKFWSLYDPADPGTAPTNQQVIDWLIERGVAQRTAEVIATILRADGLPTGPRK